MQGCLIGPTTGSEETGVNSGDHADPPFASGKAIRGFRHGVVVWGCPIILYALGFFVFFRDQIFSNFDLVFGDRGDARFVVFIHEHVFQSIFGRSDILSPPFFFDQENTLGYSEAFLLDQIIYAPSRLLGADQFLATTLVPIFLSLVSFASLYLVLRRLCVSPFVASPSAFIFTFANNLFLNSLHLQHFVSYFLPIVALCTVDALLTLKYHPQRAFFVAGIGSFLFGMMFSTSFYIAWFFAFDLMIFVPLFVYLSWPDSRQWWQDNARNTVLLSIVTATGFLAGLFVFAIVYGPVILVAGHRDFSEYLTNAPNIFDIVNVGVLNFVWGWLIRTTGVISAERLTFTEVTVALTPIVQCMVLTSLVLATRRKLWLQDSHSVSRAAVIAAAVVPFIFFLFTIKVGNFSLFRLCYGVIPGAGIIRAGYRGMVVANLFAVVAIALCFERVFSVVRRHNRWALPVKLAATAALASAMIEQLNLAHPTVLSRSSEYSHLAKVENPPSSCHSFYALDQSGYQPYEVQLDAMLVALWKAIPTVNGYSGISPDGWDFYDTKDPAYEHRVYNWASQRGVANNLCRLDVIHGIWTTPADPALMCLVKKCVPRLSFDADHEFRLVFKQGGNAEGFTNTHWNLAEPWGRWTSDRQASISFSLIQTRNISFEMTLRGLLSVRAPQQFVSIYANDCKVASATLGIQDGVATAVLSGTISELCIKSDGIVVLEIDTDRASTPQELGLNSDQRHLGIGVEEVVFHQRNMN
jgi:hypothetical protein